MRIVTLEEHISFPEMKQFLPEGLAGYSSPSPMIARMTPMLEDITGERLKSMDGNGNNHAGAICGKYRRYAAGR
jgi:hypothetical protein